ncbi:MSS51 C-terminal domain-containing protein [Variovorax sp. WDL1]|uniref:MSS51 C-terminal domain-containing protein n=1 Tax=Variovorax sp. WDL1 TaxID=207745 RepID=UPI0018DDEFDC|nr:MSS51 C-terminal domain-containing protein [Variovorax sp. WDL1]
MTQASLGLRLKRFPKEFLQTVLVAPATVARWIAQEVPALLERPHLHVVIAGAAKGPDSLDEGRWYQYLPTLLGRPKMTVRVTLVGPELKQGTENASIRSANERSGIITSAGADAVSNLPTAELAADALSSWWAERPQSEATPDVCFVFHPGMEAFGGSWLSREQGLLPLMDAGVPIGLAASCVEELWHDEWLVRKYGAAMRGLAQANPFALERDNARFGGQWAALTWTLDPTLVPAADFKAIKAELVRFYLALDQAKPGFSSSGNAIFGFIGGVVPIQNVATDERARLVGMPAGVLLCLESGQLLGQNTVGRFELVERIPAVPLDFLADFPGEEAHPVDRFIWASEKFRGYVEPVLLSSAKRAPETYFDLFGSPLEARKGSMPGDPGPGGISDSIGEG